MPDHEWRGRKDTYRFLRGMGEGLLSSVELVADSAQRQFVLKRASDPSTDLSQEAEFLERLREHPGVIHLVDRVETDGQTVGLVLEHLQGYLNVGSDLLSAEGFTGDLAQLLDLCGQLCEVLAAAHEEGIEYGDFKPEHLFWNGRQLRVVDWNAARPLSEEGVASDLYKFGEVLLHLLTGSPIPRLRPRPNISFVRSDPQLLVLDYPEDTLPPSLAPLVERVLRGEYSSAESLVEEIRLHAQIHLQLPLPPASILGPIESLMDHRRHREAAVYLKQVRGQVGDQDTVEDLLREALDAQETLVMAYRTRAAAEARAGLWDKAASSYKRAWREAPDDLATFLHYLGCSLVAQGELAGESQAHFMQAAEAFGQGRFEESLSHLRALGTAETGLLREVLDYVAKELVPHILARLDDPSQVGPIVQFFPDSALIQARYGELLADKLEDEIQKALQAHDYQAALQVAGRLQEHAPENELAGAVLRELSGLPEAVEEGLRAAGQGDMDRAAALLAPVVRCAWVRGDERVERAWARACAEQRMMQAREARKRGTYPQAVSLLEQCRQELEGLWHYLEPPLQKRLEAETRVSRAWAEYALGEYEASVQELEETVRSAPEIATWQEDLGFVRKVASGVRNLAEGAWDEAVHLLEEACRIRPGEEQAAHLLSRAKEERNRERVRVLAFQKAQAAAERGDFDRALELYQHLLLEGYATEAEVRDRVGEALSRQAQRTQERLWQEALALREAGRLSAAAEVLKRLLEQAPAFPGAAEELAALEEELGARARQSATWGKQAFEQGDLALARKHFLEALEHAPDAPEARAYLADMDRLREHLEEGQQALNADRPAEAINHFRRALLLCPASPEVQVALHEARRRRELQARNEEMARQSLQRAEEALGAGQLAEGQGYLQDLVALSGIPPDLELRGRVLQVEAALLAHRPDEARQYLKSLGLWLEGRGWHRERELTRLRQALAEEESRQREASRQVEEWLKQGRAALAEGRLAEAEEAASRILALRPKEERASGILQEARRRTEARGRSRHLMASARALLALGEVAQAEKTAQRALELTPEEGDVQAFLRQVRVQRGLEEVEKALAGRRFEQAEAAAEQVLRLDPAHPRAPHLLERIQKERQAYLKLRQLVGKGSTSLHLRDYRQAVACFAQALELNPDDPEVQARYEQALRGLQEVVATHRELADQALAHHDFEAADAYLKVAEELAPADPALVTLRAGLDRAVARQRTLQERAAKGDRALLMGNYEDAAEFLEWAAAELPEGTPDRTRLQESAKVAREMQTLRIQARNALESRMYDQAISLLERILGQFPRDEESRTLLQECLNQREEATRMIQQLLKQVRQSEQGGQYDRALDLCITAENVYPWQREITASRQRIHKLQMLLELMQRALQFGNQEEAWALAREGYELNPYDTRFQQVVREGEYASTVSRARDALERGHAGEAVEVLSTLMKDGFKLKGADHDLWELASAIAAAEETLLQGDYAAAENTLRPVAREHPVSRRLWQRIRRAHRLSEQGHQALNQAGDLDEAERCFRLILADGIDDENAREGLRRVISSRVEKLRADSEDALDRGDSAAAFSLAQRALREAPDDPTLKAWVETCEKLHALLTAASQAYARGDRAAALAHWSEGVQVYPSPAVVSLIERVEQEQARFVNRLWSLLTGRGVGERRAGKGG
ncbi:MAG: protein kinase domain-containing protein [Anaerolineae bacterium]